ncbi:hypothetical protein GW537_06125 [Piscirickettsia salmonis]|nr:hypothetical protein GW538_06135 [Piscirickettsia salmonis]QHS28789.1 hypothetical protein GW537_06125 [Piscirickettsia salmonis]
MLGDFASLDVQNTYRGSDAYVTHGQVTLPTLELLKAGCILRSLLIYTLEK